MKVVSISQITKENRELGETWAKRLEAEGLLFGRPVCGSGWVIATRLQEGTISTFEEAKKLFMEKATEEGIHSYLIHWKDWKTEYVYGESATDAFNKAGIGAGALSALDYYEEVA